MSSQAEAEQAIKLLNGRHYGDRDLTVNIARPREERGSGGGGYGAVAGAAGLTLRTAIVEAVPGDIKPTAIISAFIERSILQPGY
jgi:hypothetical protein